MSYVLAEIVWYLFIAGLIGFVVGWFARGESKSKTSDKNEKMEKEPESKVETASNKVSVSSEIIKEEVQVEESVTEISKEDKVAVSIPVEATDKTIEDASKPVLLSKEPESKKDKLSSLKGIGPVLEKKLNDLGVYSFEQIASWDRNQELWIGTQILFPKKVIKEEWVKQAKELLEATSK